MFKNKLKQILAVAALGCLTASAQGQLGYTRPAFSARWGGPVVSGMNVGYYSNGVSLAASPALMNAFYPRMAYASALSGGYNGTVYNPTVRRMPADGTIVPLAIGSAAGSTGGTYLYNGTVYNPTVRRMPADGTIVPLSIGSGAANGAYLYNGTVYNPTVRRMPANGTIVPLSVPHR